MNETSSRSHTLCRILVESRVKETQREKHGDPQTERESFVSSLSSPPLSASVIRFSSLTLVDLAGSESSKSSLYMRGERQRESRYINQSLLTLSTIIMRLSEEEQEREKERERTERRREKEREIEREKERESEVGSVDGERERSRTEKDRDPRGKDRLKDRDRDREKPRPRPHLPYRDSKLTRLLEPSLSGHGRVLLLCTLSPLSLCLDESLSTIRFGLRAKTISVNPVITERDRENNGSSSHRERDREREELLKEYREEIERLREKLKALETERDTHREQSLQL